MQMRLYDLLEANGIRVTVVSSPNLKEMKVKPFGLAMCGSPHLSEEQHAMLVTLGLAAWYSSYSYLMEEQSYSGYVVAMWYSMEQVRQHLEQTLEVEGE